MLVEGENIISTDKEVVDTMNNFFSYAEKSLDIPSNSYLINFTNLDDPIDQIKYKYKSHRSIIKIMENFGNSAQFSFMEISYTEMEHELNKANVKKFTTFKNIPTKSLKDTLREEIFCGRNFYGRNFCGIYFCDFDSQKFLPQKKFKIDQSQKFLP